MLKHQYESLEAIPENLRGAYVSSGGKYVLDHLSDDHPLIVKNSELVTEKRTAGARAETLQSELSRVQDDLASARTTGVPRGHVAVAKSDADLLERVKAHGSGEEVVAKLTEHKTLKEETDKRKREDSLREVAKVMSYEPEAFVRLPNLPEFEIRDGKDGQKTVVAKLKDDKGVITEKPAQEFIESSGDIAPFLPALRAQANGVKVHGSSGNSGTPAKDVFTRIRQGEKERQEVATADINPMFRKLAGHQQAQTGE